MTLADKAFLSDPHDGSPVYLQLARHLTEAMQNGRYLAGQALPAERILAEQMALSRVTVRKAIEQLVQQGQVTRKPGSGTFVAERVAQPLARLTSFTEQMTRRGMQASTRWLKRAIVAANIDQQQRLGLPPNANVVHLERARLADGVVLAFEVNVLPEIVCGDPENVGSSLYEHLSERGYLPVRALQQITCINAPATLAELLALPVGQAVLSISRVCFDESGRPVELTHAYCKRFESDQTAELIHSYCIN